MSDSVVRRIDDLKSVLVLAGAFAIAAACTVPLLLPALPPEARSLPLPLPVFCAILAVQLAVVYGALGFAGLRAARSRGLEPAPALSALWAPGATSPVWASMALAFAVGLGCGALLVVAVHGIQRFFPGTLPALLHPPGVAAAFLASTAASLGEEILFRLFVLSVVLRLLPRGRVGLGIAVVVSALTFAAAHAPALVYLFGGLQEVPVVAWIWIVSLNAVCGVAYGLLFLRYGIECAVLAHLYTDIVWHVASQAFGG